MKRIDGKARTISEILKGKRYGIDYYQRDYRWGRKQAEELIEDLAGQFLQFHRSGNARSKVADYGNYFLGSIILSERDGKQFIVDGQQRLTTITLLLILLHRRQGSRSDRVKLEDLIYSEKYGEKSFNLLVEDRQAIMTALFNGEVPDTSDASESVQTIVDRYQDLDELLQAEGQEIDDDALPYFCDWLTEKVHIIEITAASDDDAYTIFETMNDRGLSLTPLDMLKGYLLANISDVSKRNEAAQVWKERMDALRKLGKDEDTDGVKAWLRALYANSVRERRSGSENKDFERIGTEFHRWLGDNADAVGLKTSEDYFLFVCNEMAFYTRQYERLRKASKTVVAGLEPVYHVACFNFTLQYPIYLAPLLPGDTPDLIDQKIRLAATFLDILLARRAVNYLSMTYGAMSYAVFLIMRDVRGKSLPELREILKKRLDEQGCDFNGTKDGNRNGLAGFGLNQWSKRYIKVLLARMTAYVEQASGLNTSVATYLGDGRGRHEIEHIWADKYERHKDEFTSSADFADYRNRFGDLLLLPKTFNGSYGALTYPKKVKHYVSQNLLAWSLNAQCYDRNPKFLAFIKDAELPFEPYEEFHKAELDKRHALYGALADKIWDASQLDEQG